MISVPKKQEIKKGRSLLGVLLKKRYEISQDLGAPAAISQYPYIRRYYWIQY
jgi:hypothetical protein